MPGFLTVSISVSVGPVWAEPVILLRYWSLTCQVLQPPHLLPPRSRFRLGLPAHTLRELSVLPAFLLLLPLPSLTGPGPGYSPKFPARCAVLGYFLCPASCQFLTFGLSVLSVPIPPSPPPLPPLLSTPPPTWAALTSSGCTPTQALLSLLSALFLSFSSGRH